MKKNLCLILAVCLVLTQIAAVSAFTDNFFCVAQNGNVDGPGTSASPFATLNKAVSAAKSAGGGNIIVKGGEYEPDDTISVMLNGAEIDFADVEPQIIKNRTMVPLRVIFEALGATVDWDDGTKTVTAVLGETAINMTIGKDSFTRNGESVSLDSPATIVDSRTLVPVRAIAEAFGASVSWVAESKTVVIEKEFTATEETDRIRAIKPDEEGFYKTAEGVRLPYKMYNPKVDNGNKTAFLIIHGGAWYAVKEDSDTWDGSNMQFQAQYYADKGYKTLAISYRDIKLTEDTDCFDLIEDCKDAVKFMRENMDFEKLVIMGESSGGHLACMLGFDDEIGADVIVGLNPVLDVVNKWNYVSDSRDELEKLSPAFNPKKTGTKFLIMHGSEDSDVDPKVSAKFCEDMKALGNNCEYIELEGKKHSFIISRYLSADEEVLSYMGMIDEYLSENL